MGTKNSLRSSFERCGLILPEPGPDLGGRLATSLLTHHGLVLSAELETTAILNLARSAGLLIPPGAIDIPGCLESAVTMRLAEESGDPNGQALATFYAALWSVMAEAGQEIPAEETASANDELKDTGWLVVRDGKTFKASPNGEEEGGVRLAFGHAPYRHLPKMWVRYYGPRKGEGWKNISTGDVVYGGGQPGTGGESDTDVQQRIDKSKDARKRDRMEQGAAKGGKPSPHLPQSGNVSPEAARDARRPLAALFKAHGEQTMSRINELAHLVGQSLSVLPRERQGLSSRLQQILQILSAMHSMAKNVLPGKGSGITKAVESSGPGVELVRKGDQSTQSSSGQINPEVPKKPQSPFMPKRGTS